MENNVGKALVKSILLNLLAGFIGVLPFIFLNGDQSITWGFLLIMIAVISLFIQLVVALFYISNPQKKHVGQGMLLSVGLYLLIGLAVCGPIWFS